MGSRRPLRVLHTSDVHLGSGWSEPTGRAHRKDCLCPIEVIEQVVREHAVDVVLVVGDLFDHARVPESMVADAFARLGALPADVALLPGNHDQHDDAALYRRFRDHVDRSGVVLFDELHGMTHDLHDGALRVWARAMDEHTPGFVPLAEPHDHPGDRWYIVAGHGHFVDDATETHRSSRISIEDLEATDADYVALGHWHVTTDLRTRGVDRLAWYSGAPLFGYGAGNVLLVDFDEEHEEGPVRVGRVEVLGHPAASCP